MTYSKSSIIEKSTLSIAILGIISCFMSWVYYPKLDLALEGIKGDGILFIIFFTIIALVTVFVKQLYKKYALIPLGILVGYFALRKWYKFSIETDTYNSDDLMLASMGSGVQLKFGFYLLLCSCIALLFLTIINILSRNKWTTVLLSLLFTIASMSFILYEDGKIIPESKDKNLEILQSDFSNMNYALSTQDFNSFMDYIHPDIIIAMGGKKKLLNVLLQSQNKINHKVLDVSILKSVVKDNTLQALINADVEIDGKLVAQIYYAIKPTRSKTWHFISQVNGSFKETKNQVPSLSDELNTSNN